MRMHSVLLLFLELSSYELARDIRYEETPECFPHMDLLDNQQCQLKRVKSHTRMPMHHIMESRQLQGMQRGYTRPAKIHKNKTENLLLTKTFFDQIRYTRTKEKTFCKQKLSSTTRYQPQVLVESTFLDLFRRCVVFLFGLWRIPGGKKCCPSNARQKHHIELMTHRDLYNNILEKRVRRWSNHCQ